MPWKGGRSTLDQVILKGQGKVIAESAIPTQRPYEGWRAWSGVGACPKHRETWASVARS